jgi:hypothetical protein
MAATIGSADATQPAIQAPRAIEASDQELEAAT